MGMMEMGDAEPRTMLCLVRRPRRQRQSRDRAKGQEEQIKFISRDARFSILLYFKVCILFIVTKMQH